MIMAKRETLLSVRFITDDQTGMYGIDEIDFGISGNLNSYLERNGIKGRDEILQTLGYLAYVVGCTLDRVKVEDESQKVEMQKVLATGN